MIRARLMKILKSEMNYVSSTVEVPLDKVNDAFHVSYYSRGLL